jgi:hypothetical protein
MPHALSIACLFFTLTAWAQPARPHFYADRVIPSFGDTPVMLAPAMLVSIYGENLGPEEGCRGYGDQTRVETLPPDNPFGVWERIVIYPTSLCGVQVKIGDGFAGLLWAQDKQINFEVPKDVPFGGSAELRVIKDGVASDPVRLEFGLERIKLTQDEPAYVGMPVWIRVHTSTDAVGALVYPIHNDPLLTGPTFLACEVLEARWNGVPLPRIMPINRISTFIYSGPPCPMNGLPAKPSKTGRLPFHLLFRFEQAGQYEVRFTRLAGDGQARERSAWTTIVVQPAEPSQRAEWLRTMVKTAPKKSAELLSDFLPSVLGYGDASLIPVLINYLYEGDGFVQRFVANSLRGYYDKALLVPALQRALREKGSSLAVDGLLRSLP